MSITTKLENLNQVEITHGLNRLKQDISTGNIANIIEKYKNEEGDYLFIKAKKKNKELF